MLFLRCMHPQSGEAVKFEGFVLSIFDLPDGKTGEGWNRKVSTTCSLLFILYLCTTIIIIQITL